MSRCPSQQRQGVIRLGGSSFRMKRIASSGPCSWVGFRNEHQRPSGRWGLPGEDVPGVQVVAFEEVASELIAMPSASGIQIEAIRLEPSARLDLVPYSMNTPAGTIQTSDGGYWRMLMPSQN